jgi:hypothetical protein
MKPGKNYAYRCDVGMVTSTDGLAASNRLYWSGTGFNMADLPAQARLKPNTWGVITLKQDPVNPITPVAGDALRSKFINLSIAGGAGHSLSVRNPFDFPVRLTLLTLSGQVVARAELKPGTHGLALPSMGCTAWLYRIEGKGVRVAQGKITVM